MKNILTIEFPVLTLILALAAASSACTKNKPSYVNASATPVEAASTAAATDPSYSPSGPVLATDPNCADLEKGEAGHSPGPGMNHCPKNDAKVETENKSPEGQSQTSLGGR